MQQGTQAWNQTWVHCRASAHGTPAPSTELNGAPGATLASTFLVLTGESVPLHCDSRPSWTASCDVYLHIIHCSFIILMLSRKMTLTCCLSISQRSASPELPVLHALLYETHQTSVHTGTL